MSVYNVILTQKKRCSYVGLDNKLTIWDENNNNKKYKYYKYNIIKNNSIIINQDFLYEHTSHVVRAIYNNDMIRISIPSYRK